MDDTPPKSQYAANPQLDLSVELDDPSTLTVPATSFSAPGKDEMNLAEFPFAVLAKRAAGQKTIEVIQEGRDALGRPIRQEWLVTGSDHFGLPVATDDDTYVALMKLLRDNQFRDRTVRFTVAQLLRIMHSHTGKRDYERVAASLDRLTGVLLRSKNAFWDHSKRSYVTEAFHLLDSYRLATGGSGRELSEVTFSQFLFGSIQAGYVKNLDVDFYFSLSTPLGRRLYRLLDKHRYRAQVYDISLERLARKLPLQDKYESQIKRRLDPVFAEFIERGFLSGVQYRPGAGGGTVIRIRFADRDSPVLDSETLSIASVEEVRNESPEKGVKAPQNVTQGALTALQERLVAVGVSRAVAEELVQNHPAEEVERQLAYLPYVQELKNPGGYLRQAIAQGYGPPPKYSKKATPKTSPRKSRPASAATAVTAVPAPPPTSLPVKPIVAPASEPEASIDHPDVSEELRSAWKEVIRVLAATASRPAFETHIRPLRPLRLEPSRGDETDTRLMYIEVPSAFTREWVMKHYRNQISEALSEALAPESRVTMDVRFVLPETVSSERADKKGVGE